MPARELAFRLPPPAAAALLTLALLPVALAWFGAAAEAPAAEPSGLVSVRHQVVGLFAPDRVEDLRQTMHRFPKVALATVDYDAAEATFVYDPKQAFPGASPERIVQLLDIQLRQASRGTFGVRPLRSMPRESLERIEIPVAGLDCKACSLAAYEIVLKVEGVEQATASFKDGLVTALIDPQKTNRAAVEAALKLKGVKLEEPAAANP